MKTTDALNDIVWYNCYEDMLRSMKRTIQKAKKRGESTCLWEDREEYDLEVGYIFWSLLVLKFGDYGISSRRGWIESENYAEAIKYIRALLAGHPTS